MKTAICNEISWFGTCLAVAVIVATAAAGAPAADQRAGGPLKVGSQKQLFIDHKFIESSENVSLVVNPPVKRPEPILRSDKPWDAFRLIFFSVAEDDGLVKMWYQAFDGDQWGGGTSRLCYAISKDGLHWEKPNLGLVEYNGSKDNNILLAQRMFNAFVFIDPHGEPERRYKMLFSPGAVMRAGVSADGIHWTLLGEDLTAQEGIGYDVQPTAFWDPVLKKYAVYPRVSIRGDSTPHFPFPAPIASDPPVVAPKLMRPGRAIGRIEVDDFLAPWPMEKMQTVLAADEIDPPGSDLYLPYACRYPYAADAYFMFPETYQHFRGDESDVGNDGVNDTQFAASRDGVHWMRYDRKVYLGCGLPGEPDFGAAQPTAYHVRRGNYLYYYYWGWPWTHGGFRRLSTDQRHSKANWGRQLYAVAIQRLDGFVSADAPYAGGWLATPPIVFEGNRLELNVNVAAMGVARVEIQDADGKPLPGFSLDDCNRILFNDVAHTVRWGGKSDVSSLAGKPVRLRIQMRSAKLYAFQFRGPEEKEG